MQSLPKSYAILCQSPITFREACCTKLWSCPKSYATLCQIRITFCCTKLWSCPKSYATLCQIPITFRCTKLWSCPKSYVILCNMLPKLYAILCNMFPKVGSDFVQCIAQSCILPRLAQIPTSVKQWSTYPSCAKCHLQPYKHSM